MGLFSRIAASVGWDSGSSLRNALAKIDANFQLIEPSVKVSAAANYQPVLGDRIIRRTKADAQTLTIPTNATVEFPVGTELLVEQAGAGQLTIVAAGGVTIEREAKYLLTVESQFGVARLIKMDVNIWVLTGDMTID